LEVSCMVCNAKQDLEVNEHDFHSWQSGTKIQNAMPYLSADERELLISGTCSKCFDEMFGEDE